MVDAIIIENIAGYGDIVNVSLLDNSSNSDDNGGRWVYGSLDFYNFWIFENSGEGFVLPFTLNLTDSDGNTISASNIITNSDEYSVFVESNPIATTSTSGVNVNMNNDTAAAIATTNVTRVILTDNINPSKDICYHGYYIFIMQYHYILFKLYFKHIVYVNIFATYFFIFLK